MADNSFGSREELHESDVSLRCFDLTMLPQKCLFFVDLFCFISLCQRVAMFLNATRRDRNLPPFTSKGK